MNNKEFLRCLDIEAREHGGEVLDKKLNCKTRSKSISLEQAYDKIKVIFAKFEDKSEATDMEVKTLLRELARGWEKDIDEDYGIVWEV